MAKVLRITAAALVAPAILPAAYFVFSRYVLGGYVSSVELSYVAVVSYACFFLLFAPAVVLLSRAHKLTPLVSLAVGALFGALLTGFGLFMALAGLGGHGGAGLNIGSLFAQALGVGAVLGAAVSSVFCLGGGLTIRSSGPLRIGTV